MRESGTALRAETGEPSDLSWLGRWPGLFALLNEPVEEDMRRGGPGRPVPTALPDLMDEFERTRRCLVVASIVRGIRAASASPRDPSAVAMRSKADAFAPWFPDDWRPRAAILGLVEEARDCAAQQRQPTLAQVATAARELNHALRAIRGLQETDAGRLVLQLVGGSLTHPAFSDIDLGRLLRAAAGVARQYSDAATEERRRSADRPKHQGRPADVVARAFAMRCGEIWYAVTDLKPRSGHARAEEGAPGNASRSFPGFLEAALRVAGLTAKPRSLADHVARKWAKS